ncbi:hypothetical protein RFI_26788, partial [Reticulomyxa filosa]
MRQRLEDIKVSLKFTNGMFNEKRKMFELFFFDRGGSSDEKLVEKLFPFFRLWLKKKQNNLIKIKMIVIEKSIILKRTCFNTFDVHIIGIQKEISTQFVQVTILTFFLFEGFVYNESGDLSGGMQHNTEPNKNAKEIKALMTLFGDAVDESELKKRLEENNGNV